MKGVVHCANEGITPLAQFLYEVERSYSRASGRGLVVNVQSYAPNDFLSPCDLPINNTLDISLFKKETAFNPRQWKDALDDFMSVNFQYL
jgi:dTDP-4-dehydrorhamnose reductase